MKTINIATRENVHIDHFPDNQRHVTVNPDVLIPGSSVRVVAPLRGPNEVLTFMSVIDALHGSDISFPDSFLEIPYLYGARSDRQFKIGDSIELRMISGLISSPKFGDVQILDPHTKATYSLIPNSRPMLKANLRVPYNNIGPSAVIFPDAHAMDHGVTWHAKEGFTFDKQRHSNRSVTLVGPGVKFDHIHCFVVDDICDGGATFIELAKHISNPASLTLCVTHGIFSKGVERLFDAGYTKIITTNSYCEIINDSRVEIIDVLQ